MSRDIERHDWENPIIVTRHGTTGFSFFVKVYIDLKGLLTLEQRFSFFFEKLEAILYACLLPLRVAQNRGTKSDTKVSVFLIHLSILDRQVSPKRCVIGSSHRGSGDQDGDVLARLRPSQLLQQPSRRA
jgi:hypothetical protein